MPDLVLIFGAPASGKAAVGHALAEQTGYRFLHNHMTAEAVGALFGWGNALFDEVAAEVRLLLLSRALALEGAPPVITTFFWAFNKEQDSRFVEDLVRCTERAGGTVFFVELLASSQARKAREGTPLRTSLKPSKRDVESARALHDEVDAKYQMNSDGNFPYPRHLVIDTERQPPEQAARLIAQHFALAPHGH